MGRTTISSLALIAAMLSGGPAGAAGDPYNENGWIKADAWNLLFPLTNPYGCDGGGPGNMLRNWVAPHELTVESPQNGTRWKNVDFGGQAAATGFEMEDVWRAFEPGEEPVHWVTTEALATLPFLDPAGIPRGDYVEFQGLIDVFNQQFVPALAQLPIQSDNVLGIAQTYVRNTTGAPICIWFCSRSDDSIQIWLNDKLVTNKSVCRPMDADCSESSPAVLEPGINRITVLTWEGVGGWSFGLSLGYPNPDTFSRLSNLNQDQVLFTGPTLAGAVVNPSRIALSRSSVNPDCCPAANPTKVTIRGNGKNPGSGIVREVYSASEILGITAISNGGVLTYDGGAGAYTIEWSTAAAVLNDTGVSYSVDIAPGKTAHPKGQFEFQIPACEKIGGEEEIKGSWPHTGPRGPFDDSHDIGAADQLDEGAGALTVTAGPDGALGTSDDICAMKGSGKDVWNDGDSFQFAYRKVAGDFSATVRVTNRTFPATGGRWGRYGLMARKDCSPTSKYSLVNANLEVDPGAGADHLRGDAVYYQFRRNDRVSASTDQAQYLVFPDPDGGGPQLVNQPSYFRLERRGNTFTGYASFDNVKWRLIGSDTWYGANPTEEILVGFMHSKHLSAPQAGTITFTDFKVSAPTQFEIFNNDLSKPVKSIYKSDWQSLPDGAVPAEIQVNCGANCGAGGFTPQIVTAKTGVKRLRLTQDGVAGNASSVFFKNLKLPSGTGKIVVEYTVWMAHAPTQTDPVPGDGMTLTFIAGDSLSRVGSTGSGLGYEGLGRKSFDDAAPSFSVECDSVDSGGNNEGAGSPSAPGRWHVGINSAGNVHSLAMWDAELPDVYTPAGCRFRVELTSEGKVSVFVVTPGGGGAGGDIVPVVDAQGEPLGSEGDGSVQVGFTGSTGSSTQTTEVGGIDLGTVDCSDTAEVAQISGPSTAAALTKVTLNAGSSNSGFNDLGEGLTYTWFLDPSSVGKASLKVESFSPSSADVAMLIEDGEVIVGVIVDDHRCPRPTSSTTTHTIQVGGGGARWVNYDVNGDGTMDLSDAVAHIKWFFLGDTEPECKSVLDFNGDGSADAVTDAVAALGFLFLGNPPPPLGMGCLGFKACSGGCGCGGPCK